MARNQSKIIAKQKDIPLTMRLLCRHGSVVGGIAALAFILVAAPVQAGWLARMIGVGGVAHSMKKNLGELLDHVGDMSSAVMRGDGEKVEQIWKEIEKTPAKIIKEAFPVLKAGDAAIAAKERITKGLQSADRKISRLFSGNGGVDSPDPRAALAVDKASRREYAARSDVFDKQRLLVRVPVRSWADDTAGSGPNEDVWADADGDGWDDGAGTDTWADDTAGSGPNKDVWADAGGGGWDDGAGTDTWDDDTAGSGPNKDVWADAGGGGWDELAPAAKAPKRDGESPSTIARDKETNQDSAPVFVSVAYNIRVPRPRLWDTPIFAWASGREEARKTALAICKILSYAYGKCELKSSRSRCAAANPTADDSGGMSIGFGGTPEKAIQDSIRTHVGAWFYGGPGTMIGQSWDHLYSCDHFQPPRCNKLLLRWATQKARRSGSEKAEVEYKNCSGEPIFLTAIPPPEPLAKP